MQRITAAQSAITASAALAIVLLSGCGAAKPDYVLLQDAIKSHITRVDHRPVNSVECAPHVNGTVREEVRHLTCLVKFSDGSSYRAKATITNENSGGAHNLPDAYEWDSPPQR